MKRGRPRIHARGVRLTVVRMEVSASLARLLRAHYGSKTTAGAIRRAMEEAEERALAETR